MKILGIFSFIFGLGLLAFAGFGFYQEIRHSTTTGEIAIILLVTAGLSVILFVLGTFYRKKIYAQFQTNDNIIDLPDHIVEEEQTHKISGFIIGCGIVSMIVGTLMVLYCVYSLYSFIRMSFYLDHLFFRIEFLIIGGFLIFSILTLIYCIRKLFFSRK